MAGRCQRFHRCPTVQSHVGRCKHSPWWMWFTTSVVHHHHWYLSLIFLFVCLYSNFAKPLCVSRGLHNNVAQLVVDCLSLMSTLFLMFFKWGLTTHLGDITSTTGLYSCIEITSLVAYLTPYIQTPILLGRGGPCSALCSCGHSLDSFYPARLFDWYHSGFLSLIRNEDER